MLLIDDGNKVDGQSSLILLFITYSCSLAQSLRYHNRKSKPDNVQVEDQARKPPCSSVTSPTGAASLDHAAVWSSSLQAQASGIQQYLSPLFPNPEASYAPMREVFHPPEIPNTLKRVPTEDGVFSDDFWRNVAFLQGGQDTADRLLQAYREEV